MAQVTAVTPVARALGVNRIVQGRAVVNVVGDWELPPHEEKELRRELVLRALDAIQSEPNV